MARYYIGTAGWSYEDWEGIVYPAGRDSAIPSSHLSGPLYQHRRGQQHVLPASGRSNLSVLDQKISERSPISCFRSSSIRFSPTSGRISPPRTRTTSSSASSRSSRPADWPPCSSNFPGPMRTPTPTRTISPELFRLFSGYPLALEVRHSSWNSPDFFKLLREHKVGFCNIDQPVIGQSLKPSAIVTNPDFSYVRLHGRNYQAIGSGKARAATRATIISMRKTSSRNGSGGSRIWAGTATGSMSSLTTTTADRRWPTPFRSKTWSAAKSSKSRPASSSNTRFSKKSSRRSGKASSICSRMRQRPRRSRTGAHGLVGKPVRHALKTKTQSRNDAGVDRRPKVWHPPFCLQPGSNPG